MTTTKRQLSFYAESDVDLYLSLVGPGSKTAILNTAIRSRIITDAIVDLNDGRRPAVLCRFDRARNGRSSVKPDPGRTEPERR